MSIGAAEQQDEGHEQVGAMLGAISRTMIERVAGARQPGKVDELAGRERERLGPDGARRPGPRGEADEDRLHEQPAAST